MSTPPPPFPGRQAVRTLQALLLAAGLVGPAVAGPARTRFDVPAGDAVQTLRVFSVQSREEIVYPVEQVRGTRTRPVQGEFTSREALEVMLARTGLVAVEDAASGALTVRRDPRRNGGPEAPVRPRTARFEAPAGAARETGRALDAVVELSPFEVRGRAAPGYDAANSVTATGMAVPIGRLPMAITAFTEEFIADQQPYDPYDVIKWAPGVHQDNVSPQGWARYNIRGFTSAAVRRNGFGSIRFIDTANIAQVEVVKGPSSLLYGQINPGGVINYLTKRPERAPSQRLDVTAGTHGHRRVVADATGPVPATGGRLLYRAIAMREDIHRFHDGEHGTKEMLAPSLTWAPVPGVALTVEYERFRRSEDLLTSGVPLIYVNNVGTVPYPGLPWDFSYAGEGDYQDFTAGVLTAELTARLGAHLDLRAAWADADWTMEWRATGQGGTGLIAQSFIDHYYPAAAGLTPRDAMYRRNRWERQWGGERTAQVDVLGTCEAAGWSARTLLGWRRNLDTGFGAVQRNNPNVAGHPHYLRPWDLRDPATWDRAVPFGVDALLPAADTRGSNRGTSLYSVLWVESPDERLYLLGGYARHELHNDPTRDLLRGTATPASDRAAFVPQAGALFRFSPAVAAYVTHSESFLANNSLLRVDNVPSVPAAPSVGTGWEGGLKLELLGGRLSGTVSAYRVRASPTGIIVVTTGLDAAGTTLFTDLQGGSQSSRGVEFDLLFRPCDGLELLASASACDAVYDRHPVNAALNGARLVATPERTFNLWAKYSFRTGPLRGAFVAGGLNHVGENAYVGNNPAVRFPAYTTADLLAGWRHRDAGGREWRAELSVKNLADRHYHASASSWGFPRHATVSAGVRF